APPGAPPASTGHRLEVDRRQGLAAAVVGGLADAELLQQLLFDLGGDVGVVPQEVAGVLLALPELVAVVGVPGARLADEPLLDTYVDQRALPGDAPAVEDVHLR